MRRADREVTERNAILEIMDNCDCLHLALMDGEYPYVIPMNFGYEDDGEHLVIYLLIICMSYLWENVYSLKM